jgi:hypothetical protein|tara:strand:+ start:674 stop:1342 length:669 start_codon:yes stop_codon:yes gene_type:complete
MIKERLKRGSLFYHLYLYYSLIFREKYFIKRKTYSQSGEDLVIKNFFKNNIGKYVDIGCFHPLRHNNTCLLFNNGWSGANIDINHTSIDFFNILRKSDLNIVAALSDKNNVELNFFYHHAFSTINSLNKENVTKFTSKYSVEKIITRKFEDVINFNFNFLNIDCEGEDFKILKTINLKKFKPELICIEILDVTEKNLFYDYLKEHDYTILEIKGLSHIFRKV